MAGLSILNTALRFSHTAHISRVSLERSEKQKHAVFGLKQLGDRSEICVLSRLCPACSFMSEFIDGI